MYTVSKGPSKIVAKTRRGLTQNLERLDSRKDYNRKSSDSDNGEIVSMPKPVFHSNGKKTVHQRIPHHVISPEHEEMIRYISETWTRTANGDSEPSTPTSTIESGSSSPDPPSNLYYQDEAPSPVLHDFKPFDLETWWGIILNQVYQRISNVLKHVSQNKILNSCILFSNINRITSGIKKYIWNIRNLDRNHVRTLYFVQMFNERAQEWKEMVECEINESLNNLEHKKLFQNGIKNALYLLNSLEHSLEKSNKYEDRLLECKKSHSHSHSINSFTSDTSDNMKSKFHTDQSKNSINLSESWSAMSIVYLQNQYEELTKKHKNLLEAYEYNLNKLKVQEGKLIRLRKRIKEKHAEVADMNIAVITVGEKYLALRETKITQKMWYEKKIERLKIAIQTILEAIDQARCELD